MSHTRTERYSCCVLSVCAKLPYHLPDELLERAFRHQDTGLGRDDAVSFPCDGVGCGQLCVPTLAERVAAFPYHLCYDCLASGRFVRACNDDGMPCVVDFQGANAVSLPVFCSDCRLLEKTPQCIPNEHACDQCPHCRARVSRVREERIKRPPVVLAHGWDSGVCYPCTYTPCANASVRPCSLCPLECLSTTRLNAKCSVLCAGCRDAVTVWQSQEFELPPPPHVLHDRVMLCAHCREPAISYHSPRDLPFSFYVPLCVAHAKSMDQDSYLNRRHAGCVRCRTGGSVPYHGLCSDCVFKGAQIRGTRCGNLMCRMWLPLHWPLSICFSCAAVGLFQSYTSVALPSPTRDDDDEDLEVMSFPDALAFIRKAMSPPAFGAPHPIPFSLPPVVPVPTKRSPHRVTEITSRALSDIYPGQAFPVVPIRLVKELEKVAACYVCYACGACDELKAAKGTFYRVAGNDRFKPLLDRYVYVCNRKLCLQVRAGKCVRCFCNLLVYAGRLGAVECRECAGVAR